MNVSKIDAAKRQLETAITLYFSNTDPVSVHTLAAAAHEILYVICKARGLESVLKDIAKRKIRKGKEKEYIDKLHEAQNFFKHGRRDPDASHKFKPELTEFFIYDACFMYIQLTKETPKPFFIFNFWFNISHPYMIAKESRDELLGTVGRAFSTHSRSAFYQEASDAYDKGFSGT